MSCKKNGVIGVQLHGERDEEITLIIIFIFVSLLADFSQVSSKQEHKAKRTSEVKTNANVSVKSRSVDYNYVSLPTANESITTNPNATYEEHNIPENTTEGDIFGSEVYEMNTNPTCGNSASKLAAQSNCDSASGDISPDSNPMNSIINVENSVQTYEHLKSGSYILYHVC